MDTTDYKQLAFKLQAEIEMLKWENAQKNINFLKEMKQCAKKSIEKKDVSSTEMLYTMIDDWIHELEKIP